MIHLLDAVTPGALTVVSRWPYLLLSLLWLLLAAGLLKLVPYYQRLLASEAASPRFHAIDGLRGHLALGVFVHHAVIRFFFEVHGRWEAPPSRLFTNLGQAGVALFFMITAFLFWNKGLRARPQLSVQPFLWTRVARLVPMYLFSVVLVFAVAFAFTGGYRQVPFKSLLTSLLAWSAFGFTLPGDINALETSHTINKVYWSLSYEWLFYLALPLLLLFARGLAFVLLLVISALFIQKFSTSKVEWCFLFGIVTAAIGNPFRHLPRRVSFDWDRWPVSVFAVACLVVALLRFDSDYALLPLLLLAGFFVCVANGNTVFGLLRLPASRFLGTISYSVYLVHCIVTFVAFRLAGSWLPVREMPAGGFWAVVAVSGVVTVVLSAWTYRFVEVPGMRLAMPRWLTDVDPARSVTVAERAA